MHLLFTIEQNLPLKPKAAQFHSNGQHIKMSSITFHLRLRWSVKFCLFGLFSSLLKCNHRCNYFSQFTISTITTGVPLFSYVISTIHSEPCINTAGFRFSMCSWRVNQYLYMLYLELQLIHFCMYVRICVCAAFILINIWTW